MTLLCMARHKLARLGFWSIRVRRPSADEYRTRSRHFAGYILLIRVESVIKLLGYSDRCPDGSILEKTSGDSSRQTDATVGRGEWRDIPLMHCVTASEEHRIRHSRAIEMGSFRLAVLSRVDI